MARIWIFKETIGEVIQNQGSGIGHVANNYLRPSLLLPKKTGFR